MDVEQRANAMLAEIASQRNAALDRCAQLSGDLADVQQQNAQLREELAELKKEPELKAVK